MIQTHFDWKKRCLIFSSSNYASFFVDVLKIIWVSGSLLQTQTSRDRYYETAVVVSPPFKNEPPTDRAQPCFTTYVCSTTKRLHIALWSEILKYTVFSLLEVVWKWTMVSQPPERSHVSLHPLVVLKNISTWNCDQRFFKNYKTEKCSGVPLFDQAQPCFTTYVCSTTKRLRCDQRNGFNFIFDLIKSWHGEQWTNQVQSQFTTYVWTTTKTL